MDGRVCKITGYGDTAYYRNLRTAERDIRRGGREFARTTLKIRGDLILDELDVTVGAIVPEADVPTLDRWQLL